MKLDFEEIIDDDDDDFNIKNGGDDESMSESDSDLDEDALDVKKRLEKQDELEAAGQMMMGRGGIMKMQFEAEKMRSRRMAQGQPTKATRHAHSSAVRMALEGTKSLSQASAATARLA